MLKVPIGSFPDDAGFDDASLLAGDNSLFGGLGNSASQMAAIRHQSRMRTPLKRCFLQKLPVKGLGTRKSCRERFAHDYFHRHR